ncbi:MAG: hypothetical protein U0641_11825 [Anaerolineae bacterium]
MAALAWPQGGIIGASTDKDRQWTATASSASSRALAVAAPENANTAVPWVALAEALRGSNSQNIFVRSFDKNAGQWGNPRGRGRTTAA